LPTSSLQHRIRSLSADELERVLDYERGHADRPSQGVPSNPAQPR
jgi:hypothetical protein